MNDLTITLIQTDLVWEQAAQNRQGLKEKIRSLSRSSDLLILPEMFTTGFSMHPQKLAESPNGPTVQWLKTLSAEVQTDITGSIIISEKDHYFNRLFYVKPAGQIFTYDKRHLFRMAGEDRIYSAGRKLLTVQLKGWNIRPFICYDLRFPAWIRNQNLEYDLGLFVANWPERRIAHWRLLLQARAVENQAFIAGVNRIGKDGHGIVHNGQSLVVDPSGNILADLEDKDTVRSVTLSRKKLNDYRQKFPSWKDADVFHIKTT